MSLSERRFPIDDLQKTRVDRILEKLARVRSEGLSCFGSEKHQFRLNKPASEAEIARCESRHGIELPPDYRAFLTYGGDGGAGPYYGISGTEEDLLRILGQAVSYSERREAVEAMGRLPALSEKGQQCVKSLLSDSDGAIRAAACGAIRVCNVVGAEEAIAKLLSDDCAFARRQAVWALMQANAKRWIQCVAERLWDDDEDVASTAFFQLQEVKSLRRDDLLEIIERSTHYGLRYCAANAVDWQQEDEALLISLLRDENAQVRFYAILGLRKIKSTASLPTALEILESEEDDNNVGSILKMLGELGDSQAKETLLAWAGAEDDFHRLDAVGGLCKLGDERVGPIAREMLREDRSPERRDELGLPRMSHMKTIRQLVKESLKSSPNQSLRNLARKRSWWPW